MKKIIYAICLIGLVTAQSASAIIPVTMSGPIPSIVSAPATGSSNTYAFTITNNVPRSFPLTVSGISGPVSRITSTNDCGNTLPAGPTTCNIYISIAPTSANAGQTFNQTLSADYQDRYPLTSNISFSVAASTTSGPAKYAYVTNFNGATPVSLCALDPTSGAITSCQSAGGGSALTGISPQGIVINTAGTIAYLSNYNFPAEAFQCPITANGTFGTCTASNIAVPQYAAQYGMIALNPAGTIAFLPNNFSGTGKVTSCPINGGVIGSSCTDTGFSANANAEVVGITLNSTGTTAYIAYYISGQPGGVAVCSVSGTTFNSCVNKTSGSSITFTQPDGIALNSTGTILYIADTLNNQVYGCSTATSSGSTFASCFVAASITSAWGITLNAQNTVAYVTADNINDTYVCPIASNGTFSSCTVTSGFNAPIGITLGYH